MRRIPARVLLGAAMLLGSPALLRAQAIPAGIVGEIQGADVSVSGGVAAGGVAAGSTAGIFVANGSEVTVHSGTARMTLFAGGEVAICGPAKFTPLQSGGAVTLALNFGEMHIRAAAGIALRIFTPTIIAAPISINGGERDATFGLKLDDSLCVRAASGAIQLEDQFSGEKLVVPQAGDFFMARGKLTPVAAMPGSCACSAVPRNSPGAAPPSPEVAEGAGTAPAPAGAPRANPPAGPEPAIEFSVPAGANEGHPVAPPPKSAYAEAPAVSTPIYKVIMPPLEFSAADPVPVRDAGPQMMLLVREAQVQPQWQFEGRVDAPPLDAARTNGAGPPETPAPRHGFWHALKRFFLF
ncbi:MAG TPA: hypothetical protein VN661_08410 [Candidatus Acidoferrales bacterium]|nr:hypothetical protein [Candidatus Acidoferrales bacterium]